MNTLLQRACYNKHTSVAALVYLALAAIDALGAIWFPDAAEKIAQTTAYLRQAAVGYGLLTAGDASPPPGSESKPPTP